MKLKEKINELNKRTSEVKKATVADFKGLTEFEYEKKVAIDEAIQSMVWMPYKKNPSFDPSVLGLEVSRLVINFRAKELVLTLADESTQFSEELDEMLTVEPQVEQTTVGRQAEDAITTIVDEMASLGAGEKGDATMVLVEVAQVDDPVAPVV